MNKKIPDEIKGVLWNKAKSHWETLLEDIEQQRQKALHDISAQTEAVKDHVLSNISNIDKKYNIETKQKIISFLTKHQVFLEEYKKKIPDGINEDVTKEQTNEYVASLLETVDSMVELNFEYEKIVNTQEEVLFNEALLRVSWKDGRDIWNFRHVNYLELFYEFWKSSSMFQKLLSNLLNDIKNKSIKTRVSMNLEVVDIMDDNFIPFLHSVSLYFKDHSFKNRIIFEILENEKIPHTPEFKQRIEKIRALWIQIAFDDTLSKEISIDDVCKNIDFLGSENLDYLKIDGKTVHSLYNISVSFWDLATPVFQSIKETLDVIELQNVKIIAEWIETKEMLDFVKKNFWIQYFQWYLFKK